MRKILLIGVPYHGNIGDSAIYYAERKFIEDNFKDYEFNHISEQGQEKCINKIAKYYDKEDIIFMHGGGNMGNVYLWHEEIRRKAIEVFSNNRIIIFPQTIHFEDSKEGQKQLQITRKIYNSHPNLTLIAREEKSYKMMKEYFPQNNVIMTPDIVMYLDETEPRQIRSGALMAMRNDKEIRLEQSESKQIENILIKEYGNVTYTDTHLGYDKAENYEKRIEIIKDKLNEFKKAEIVITDRLHGMIFASITSTPCIAFANNNHKIEYSYKWLQNLGYIKFAKKVEEVEKYIEELKKILHPQYNNDFAKESFKQIIDLIN